DGERCCVWMTGTRGDVLYLGQTRRRIDNVDVLPSQEGLRETGIWRARSARIIWRGLVTRRVVNDCRLAMSMEAAQFAEVLQSGPDLGEIYHAQRFDVQTCIRR